MPALYIYESAFYHTLPWPDESKLNLTLVSSWVMLHDQDGFVRLPNEQLLYKSPPRTSFSLQPFRSSTGSDSISVNSSGGNIYLTNQRVGGLLFSSSIPPRGVSR